MAPAAAAALQLGMFLAPGSEQIFCASAMLDSTSADGFTSPAAQAQNAKQKRETTKDFKALLCIFYIIEI
jgi:hypothetical protein